MKPQEPALLSVVVPLFNEVELVGCLLREVTRVLAGITAAYEVIMVDDGSTDGTFEEIRRAGQADPRLRGLRLSRNFGKEAALVAGLARARGQAVITLDGDLQHPPDLIPALVEKWRQGAQIVHGVKQAPAGGRFLRRRAARLFNQLFSRLAGFNVVGSSDFKLLDARIVRLLVERFPEQQRYHRGLSIWVGFRQDSVEFAVTERPSGASRWSRTALLGYAGQTLTAYTSLPLHIVPLLGGVMLLVALALGTEALISRFSGRALSGFATLEITILFSSSLIMIGLGIIGQYLARVYDEIKGRPTYLVAEEIGFPAHASTRQTTDPSG